MGVDVVVGGPGTGTFTQCGGTNTVSNLVLGLASTGAAARTILTVGYSSCSALSQGLGSAAFNFSGGTLRANGGFSTTVPMTLGTSGGGATFNTAGYTVTLSGSLSGPGSLTLNDSLGTGARFSAAATTTRAVRSWMPAR